MGHRPRNRMPVSERAKQFAPFSALTGLDNALAKKERELLYEEKKLLSEESIMSINKVLSRVEKGSEVKIEYYDEKIKRYTTIAGTVQSHDTLYGCIRVNGSSVLYDEISGIAIL